MEALLEMPKRRKRAETFADRLRTLREQAGWTQYRLSKESNVTKQTLSRLELGIGRPSWDTVLALARALGVEVNAFVVEGEQATAPAPPKQPRPKGRPRRRPEKDAPPPPESAHPGPAA